MPTQSFMPKHILVAATALTLTAVPLWAQETAAPMTREEVEQAYTSGNKEAARAGLEALVTEDDPVLSYRLAYMMINGEGGPVDVEGAVPYLEAAAKGGNTSSFTLLARVYMSGRPEIDDYTRAAELLEQALAAEDKEARIYLAQLLRQGLGVEPDPARAVDLFETAATEGDANAMFQLSQMYSRGEGIDVDTAQSARWLLEAADSGSGQAQLSLSFNYQKGTGFPQNEEKSLKWLAAAAESGVPLAQRMLGTSYLFGDRLPEDHEQGIIWLTRAAEAGEPGAQSNLGYAFATGTGVAQNDAEAYRWYSAAAERGLIRAVAAQANMLEFGRGTDEDFARAVELYQIAVKNGDRSSAIRLGSLIADGRVDPMINEENAPVWIAAAAEDGYAPALDWLKTASDAQDMYASTLLAILMREGQGMDADLAGAVPLFEAAAQAGEPLAQLHLSELYATGDGVEQDYILAHKWANLAAIYGLQEAQTARDTVEPLMSPEDLATAQRAAREFKASK